MIVPVMDRERRLEAISLASSGLLEELADDVLQTLDVEVSRGPTVGLLMVRVEEPSERRRFNFTEVTVSEAEVTAAGHRGYAMVMGRAPDKALAGAILDAAIEAGHPTSDVIEERLTAVLRDEAQRQAAAWERVSPTRVRFEEMAP
jgi:alpha-D-ribose 1-methylphosphonate 5-triphosphate synthase subunit PhnG